MVFDDSSDKIEKDNTIDFDDDPADVTDSDEEYELEQAHKMQNKYSLEVRRAIEDHLEEAKLRKKFDYFYDDEFGLDSED